MRPRAFPLVAAALFACHSDAGARGGGEGGAGAYTLTVTSRWDRDVARAAGRELGNTPADEDYRPTASPDRYEVTLSDGERRVSIRGPRCTCKGTVEKAEGGKLVFTLDEGLFAGGRFVMWRNVEPPRAELTVFGSGVPVVSSERGTLGR